MPLRGISNFADSDMEENSTFMDENSTMMATKPSASPEPPKKKGGRPKAAANKVTKPRSTATKKSTTDTGAGAKRAKKTSAPKRKALEEQVNNRNAEEEKSRATKGQSVDDTDVIMSDQVVSEDELESPKTLAQEKHPELSRSKPSVAARGASRSKAATKTRPKREETDQDDQTQPLASTIPDSQLDSRATEPYTSKNPFTNGPSLDVEVFRRSVMDVRGDNAFRDRAMREENAYVPGFTRGENPFAGSYRERPARDDASFRRRAGSASDSDRHGGDPQLRRRLGDMTRKFENVDVKYRSLREHGVTEANSNVEKLKKQCEATTAASDKLVSSLKKELAEQRAATQEHRRSQKSIQTYEVENAKLVTNVTELTANLSAAQNEIKALQAKLAASRTAATTVESTNGRGPGSAMKHNVPTRTVLVGSAEAAQAAQIAQMKEDLYSDLTGLIVRGAKRNGDEDTFDCIQTGRNGTLHFKLTIANEDNGKAASFEETEFLYTPLLDLNRDRELLEMLPDYLTEEITFSRQHAAKFYSRVVETLTKRRADE